MIKPGILLSLLIVLSFFSLFIGVSDFTVFDLITWNQEHIPILIISRIPRLLTIIMAGMSMSISGLIMQQITRNKFVSPTTATTVDAAKLGVLVSLLIIPGASSLGKMVVVFTFALVGTFLFMGLLRKIKVRNAILIPLVGIMLGNIIDSLTTFLAYRFDLVQNVSSWLMGNFSMIVQGRYELLYFSVPLLILAYVYAHQFTIAGMGEDFAKNLGLNYQRVVNLGVTIVALLSALVIITAGRIPFLGLVVPNIVALYYGDNLQKSIGATALLGAVFLLAADLVGRIVIAPYEIPIGLTVGTMGSVLFLYLVLRGNHR
jgi:iron complex transport system permease protein